MPNDLQKGHTKKDALQSNSLDLNGLYCSPRYKNPSKQVFSAKDDKPIQKSSGATLNDNDLKISLLLTGKIPNIRLNGHKHLGVRRP